MSINMRQQGKLLKLITKKKSNLFTDKKKKFMRKVVVTI